MTIQIDSALQFHTLRNGVNSVKALSILQPWATLIAVSKKHIETRSWSTRYRGPLAIHAGKRFSRADWERSCASNIDSDFGDVLMPAGYYLYERFARGAVIAVAELVDCRSTNDRGWLSSIPQAEHKYGNYSPDRFGWVLSDVRRLPEPIPAKGSLGLWDFEIPDPATAIPRLAL